MKKRLTRVLSMGIVMLLAIHSISMDALATEERYVVQGSMADIYENQSETMMESEPEDRSDMESEQETDAVSEPETEKDSESETEPETEKDSESDIEPETEKDSESETESEMEKNSDSDTQIDNESEIESGEETEQETENEAEAETEAEIETQKEPIVQMQETQVDIDGEVDEGAAVLYNEAHSLNLFAESESVYSSIGLEGTYYYVTAEKILKRINDIRYEACEEGVIDPSTGKALTLDDYKPLKWSADLEYIARVRAAEACVRNAHTRPNGLYCWSVKADNGQQSWAENLAWNWSGLMMGIEQFYEEKGDYVNHGNGKTGHYESMISTAHSYVGMSCFRLSTGGWYGVAQEFSRISGGLDETQDTTQGKCTQYIEIEDSRLTKLSFYKLPTNVKLSDSGTFQAQATVCYPDYYNKKVNFSGMLNTHTWKSSDNSILQVDEYGNWLGMGEGTVNVSVGDGSLTQTASVYVYDPAKAPLEITLPNKTTYKVGDKIVLTGGKVKNLLTGSSAGLSASNTSGFDSSRTGICNVTVSYGGFEKTFETLIVDIPECTAEYGNKLAEVLLPASEYGTYSFSADMATVLDNAGVYEFDCIFTPEDLDKFQVLSNMKVKISVYRTLDSSVTVELLDDEVIYNGLKQKPKVHVAFQDKYLTQEQDYQVTYSNNLNAGTATMHITGQGYYKGEIDRTFTIEKAPLVIKADDVILYISDNLPKEYTYQVSGLVGRDELFKSPLLSCAAVSTDHCGKYDILCSDAKASDNYEITYQKGMLVVAKEPVFYQVSFDMGGHGTEPDRSEYTVVAAGSLIPEPQKPSAQGYVFDGWYRDSSFSINWDFHKDTIQQNTVLYAKWLKETENSTFRIQEISDMIYTGNPCKPAVTIYDGTTLLKAGKDYTVTYKNNVNANVDGKMADKTGENFIQELPYVQIEGKGNYQDKVTINFNILKADISKEDNSPADGITLKYSEQLAISGKDQKAFSSIKYKKGLKVGKDCSVTVIAQKGYDASGISIPSGTEYSNGMIPKKCSGTFLLKIEGMGNYTGKILQKVYVADKSYLMKNVTVTLGSQLKSIQYTGTPITLPAAYYDSADKKYMPVRDGEVMTDEAVKAADVYTVKCGKTYLIADQDYTVSYSKNTQIGKATMTLTGKGNYMGSKSVTFNILGATFNSSKVSVEGIKELTYNGEAKTQNKVKLIYMKDTEQERELRYGTDYTISYKNNINKGTATMIFTGRPEAGFSGRLEKKFKILPADLKDDAQVKQAESMSDIRVAYEKAGVKPADCIILTSALGRALVNGTDYTVSYVNNKAVESRNADKAPTMIIKGKGNYSGTLTIPFTIDKKQLTEDAITVSISPVAYNAAKKDDFLYNPGVTVKDGKQSLSNKKDYRITYAHNDQEYVSRYMNALSAGNASEMEAPSVSIHAQDTSGYDGEVTYSLPIYQNKITASNIYVVVPSVSYEYMPVNPDVRVYYHADSKVIKTAKGLTNEADILALGLVRLELGRDYSMSYGENNRSGKNKGTVIITGMEPMYGGKVTVKFTINRKTIK